MENAYRLLKPTSDKHTLDFTVSLAFMVGVSSKTGDGNFQQVSGVKSSYRWRMTFRSVVSTTMTKYRIVFTFHNAYMIDHSQCLFKITFGMVSFLYC